MGKIFLWSILLIGVQQLAAQQTGTFSGQVIDKSSQKPLEGVTIKVLGTQLGSMSDSLGRFRINNIATGSVSVMFSALNYQYLTKYNLLITSGNENNILVEM